MSAKLSLSRALRILDQVSGTWGIEPKYGRFGAVVRSNLHSFQRLRLLETTFKKNSFRVQISSLFVVHITYVYFVLKLNTRCSL